MLNQIVFGDPPALVDRLVAENRPLVVLTGAGLTMPRTAFGRGVPGTEEMIAMVRSEFSKHPEQLERFESALRGPGNRYQLAFQHLLLTRSQDRANHIIRSAVLRAFHTKDKTSPLFARATDQEISEAVCRAAEQNLGGWTLQPALAALGQLLVHFGDAFAPLVLTSNFDPLIEISVRRAGGTVFSTALHNDGSLSQTEAAGCHVVHVHGDWFRSDTLHTPTQLGQRRPRLGAALARLLREKTLLIVGYGGWDDIFMQSLATVAEDGESKLNVVWAFYDGDGDRIQRQNARLFELLRDGIGRGRISFYAGINAHDLFPAIFNTLRERIPVLERLRESYNKDLPAFVHSSPSEPTPLHSVLSGNSVPVDNRVHYAADTNSKYLSFYVPAVAPPDSMHAICGALIKNHQKFLDADAQGNVQMVIMRPGQNPIEATRARFSNLIYFYTEIDLTLDEQSSLERFARSLDLTIVLRGPEYIRARVPAFQDTESLNSDE